MKRVALVIIAGLLALSASAQTTPRSPEPIAPASPLESAAKNQTSPVPPITVNVAPLEKSAEEKEEERRDRVEKIESDKKLVDLTAELAKFTRWLAYATIALAIVTGGLVIMGIKQASDMKRSLRINQQSADAATRSADALVGVEIARMLVTEFDIFLPLMSPRTASAAQAMQFEVGFTNHGRTTAIFTRFLGDAVVGTALPDKPDDLRLQDLPNDHLAESKQTRRYDIRAGGPISLERLAGVISEQEFIWVYGYLEYRDFMDKPHRTAFLKQFVPHAGHPNGYIWIDLDLPEAYTKSW